MLVPIVLKRKFYFDLENNGFDIDLFEGTCSDTDFIQVLLMVKKLYTVYVEMVGTDDDESLFYDYESFHMNINIEQEFFKDLAKIESKYLRTCIYGIFKERMNEIAILNGKTFRDWEVIYS